MSARSTGQRNKVVITSLVALTSVLAAMGAWRASVASGEAATADSKGFADNVARTHRRAAILILTDAIFLDFVRMHAYDDRAAALRREAAMAAPDDAARLEDQADADEQLALYIRNQIDPDAIRPDGSLDLQRKFELEFTLASGLEDLDSGPDFAFADRMRSKSEQLVLLTALFIAAALFLTLAQVSRSHVRGTYLWGGVSVLGAATVFLLVVEVL